MSTLNRNIMVTGGAGFIGSHLVRLLVNQYPNYRIVNVDALTYAGNLENLKDVQDAPNYHFEKEDITDAQAMERLFRMYAFDAVIHLAAESHVDRSISGPIEFVRTNVTGTAILLNCCKQHWQDNYEGKLFYHVSTDEVYGSLGATGFFTEATPYDPRSPYSASKAASDHLVMAWYHTYGLPVVISNCSHQFPEKLIPLMINNIKNSKPLPVYGKGENVRDWLWVNDHARAIDLVFHKGRIGQTYNIGGFNEWKNIDLVYLMCRIMDQKLNRPEGTSAQLISFVKDRPGHDMRYAIDATKINTELGWKPSVTFEEGLEKTITWYLENEDWVNHVTSGSYQAYYEHQYEKR